MSVDWIREHWPAIRTINGWQWLFEWTPEEEIELDRLADTQFALDRLGPSRNGQHNWPEVERSWAFERRRAFHADELSRWRIRLTAANIEHGKVSSLPRRKKIKDKNLSELWKYAEDMLEDYWSLTAEKIREKIIHHAHAIENMKSKDIERDITPEMIAQARAVPINKIIESQKDLISCPLHGEDKRPSASIKKGFFNCFTCGESMNSIDWLVRVEKMAFGMAVKKLLEFV